MQTTLNLKLREALKGWSSLVSNPYLIDVLFFLLLKSEGSWYADISECCWFPAQAPAFPLQMCCNFTCKLLIMKLCCAITNMLMQNFICLYWFLLIQHTYGPKPNWKKSVSSFIDLQYELQTVTSQITSGCATVLGLTVSSFRISH